MSKLITPEQGVKAWAVPRLAAHEEPEKPKQPRKLSAAEREAMLAQLNKAKEEGYREGYNQGLQEGRQAGQAQAEQLVESLVSLLNNLANPVSRMEDRVEEELVNLAVVIAKQIIRRELKTDPGQVMAVVRESLAVLPSSAQNVKVFLHPNDAALVRELLPAASGERKWEIVEDPVMSQGSCRVESDSSQVDAGFESRIAAIAAELLGSERRSNES